MIREPPSSTPFPSPTFSGSESFPKQFIPFFGERSSFQDTVLRVKDAALFDEPVVITSRDYGHLVADQLEAIGAGAAILLEPMRDRKSTRLNSSHANISYAVF